MRVALFVGLIVLAPALAGCGAKEETPDDPRGGTQASPRTPGTSGGTTTSPSPVVEAPKPKGTSERWHFHDYWKGTPTITLLDANVTLNVTPTGPDGVPSLSALVELPHGVIVPPETGYLTLNVTWEPATTGLLNVSYKPADANEFSSAGDLAIGTGVIVFTTESMCDVPHRQSSAWKFNFTAKPGGTPPSTPPRDVRVVINATIGRPLFIDPPHFDWWRTGQTIPIVEGAAGEIRAARTPATNLTLPGSVPEPTAAKPSPPTPTEPVRVPVDSGRIVPEGGKTIVAFLNWTSQMPDAKLALRYFENNYPSEGALELAKDGDGARVFTLKLAQAQTDTTYSNRTTWEFRVVPEGEPAGAFEGSFTLVAWVTKLEGAAALAELGIA